MGSFQFATLVITRWCYVSHSQNCVHLKNPGHPGRPSKHPSSRGHSGQSFQDYASRGWLRLVNGWNWEMISMVAWKVPRNVQCFLVYNPSNIIHGLCFPENMNRIVLQYVICITYIYTYPHETPFNHFCSYSGWLWNPALIVCKNVVKIYHIDIMCMWYYMILYGIYIYIYITYI